jgi:hypothetical protein
VKQPLGMFQWTADKDDTRILIRSINNAVSDEPVPQNVLDHLFDKLWPDLEKKLDTMQNLRKSLRLNAPQTRC